MPATTQAPESAAAQPVTPEFTADPSVLDVSLFDKEQRGIQYLQYAGLIKGDDSVTTLNLLKRVNHAAFANDSKGKIAESQAAFRAAAGSAFDAAKLTEGGGESAVCKLVDGYLGARVEHCRRVIAELDALPADEMGTAEYNGARHRAEAEKAKYALEQQTYRANPAMLNDAVAKYPQALAAGKYLPIGRLALECGMVEGDRAKAADMIDDTLANASAHSLLHIAEEVMTTGASDLELNRRFPDRYRTNIIAKAEDTAATTVALERAELFADSTPELGRIQAMSALLSAQLNAMTRHTRSADGASTPPAQELASNMISIPPLVKSYQSAVMSLAYHFLGEGAGKDDARMQTLRANLKAMMAKNAIPLLEDRQQAEAEAARLAGETASYLRDKSTGKPEALAKLDTLLAAARPQKEAAPETGWADSVTPPTGFAARAMLSSTPSQGVGY